MAEEATPLAETSALTKEQAVQYLLNPEPPQNEEQVASEEPNVEEEINASETTADEANQVEDEQIEDEDIDYDEAEDEIEEVEETENEEPTYRVRVGEEELDVSLDELRNSYMRQSDYTRKTQQVAEDRKLVEQELQKVSGLRDTYTNELAFIQEALNLKEQPPEYWSALKVNDPDRYTQERAQQTEQREAMENVQKEITRANNERMEEMKVAAQKRLESEAARLPELIPEWSDPSVAQKEKEQLIPYLQNVGYTTQELGNVSDSRAIMLSRKAMLYDKLMEGKLGAKKRTAKAPKIVKPGQPKTKKQVSQRRRQKAFAKIGQQKGRNAMDAAVDYLLQK